ncbi:MAG: ribonuclease P protein component [Phycisphaeraceae bacterium]
MTSSRPPADDPSDAPDQRLPRSRRLRKSEAFDKVFEARCRKNVGPLIMRGRPGESGDHRLGLMVSRRAGKAVKRNRIKRMLREAFRLMRSKLPGAYDLVVAVRPHEPLSLNEYQQLLCRGVEQIHQEWEKRRRAKGQGPGA